MVLFGVAAENGTDVFFDEGGDFEDAIGAVEKEVAGDAGVVEIGEGIDDGFVGEDEFLMENG